jgi:hypothetical protein
LVVADRQAVLTCREDSRVKPCVEQAIEYTDLPLDYLKLQVEGGVLLPAPRALRSKFLDSDLGFGIVECTG